MMDDNLISSGLTGSVDPLFAHLWADEARQPPSRPEWIVIPVNGRPGGPQQKPTVDFAMCPHPSCIESLHKITRSSSSSGNDNDQPESLSQKITTKHFAFTFAHSSKNQTRLKHERNEHEFEWGQNDKINEKEHSKRIDWPYVSYESTDQMRDHIKEYGKKTLTKTPDVDHATLVEDIRDAFHGKTAVILYEKHDGVPFTNAQTSLASLATSQHAVVLDPGGKKRRVDEPLERTFATSVRVNADDICFDIPAERFDIDALTRYWNPNFVVKRTNLSAMHSYSKPARHFQDHLKLRPWYWIMSKDMDGLCNIHEADDADDNASVLAWLEQRHDDEAQDPFWGPMVIPGASAARNRRDTSASSPKSSPTTASSTRKGSGKPVPRAFPVGNIGKNAVRRNTPLTVNGPTIQEIWEKANDASFHDYKIYEPEQGVATSDFRAGTHVAVHRSAIQFHELVCDFRLKDSGYYTVSIFIKMPQYYVASEVDPLPLNRRLWICNNPSLLRKWGYNSGLDTKSLQYPSDSADGIQKTSRIVEAPIRDWLGIQILVGPPVAKESCNPQAGNIEKYRLELSRSLVSEERRIAYTLDERDMKRAMEMGLAREWCEVPLSIKRLHVPVGNATQRILIFYGCDAIHGGYAVDRGPLIFGGARFTLVQPDEDYAGHGPLETPGKSRQV